MFYFKMYENESSNCGLFLAALPDAAAATRIHHLAGLLKRAHCLSGRLIAPERLHVSLFFLGGLPDRMERAICEAMGDVRMSPFEVSFDRTASFRGKLGSRPFVLIGERGLNQLKSLRQALGTELARQGLRRRAKTSYEPHVTLLYDNRCVEEYPVAEPVSWVVNEFVLIHSMCGHTHRARWPLRA